MFRTFVFAIGLVQAVAGPVLGATFTYTSSPLVPGTFDNGATQVVVSFTATTPLAPGKCETTLSLASYADGARTRGTIRKAAFTILKTVVKELPNGEEERIPVTYATVCLGKDGTSVTGTYQVYAQRSSGTVFEEFVANNQQPGGADLVQLDLYLGGEVPQVYSDASSRPGAWVMTP